MSDMRSFIKVEHSRFTLILRKGMLPFHWIAESHVYPDKGYVTAVRERTNYGAVWALSSRGALDQVMLSIDREREEGTERQTMSTLDILGNTSEQADSIRLMLKVRGMKDGRFIDADPLIILKADNHQGSDRWDVYVSKTVYPTAESYGTLAGILRMLANDVEIMAHEKEMGGRR